MSNSHTPSTADLKGIVGRLEAVMTSCRDLQQRAEALWQSSDEVRQYLQQLINRMPPDKPVKSNLTLYKS